MLHLHSARLNWVKSELEPALCYPVVELEDVDPWIASSPAARAFPRKPGVEAFAPANVQSAWRVWERAVQRAL